MIKDEFGFIKKNKLILLSVLVIMIIPFLYSIFFLKSVWDPYGDTQDLPVAVVNEDKAVTYNGTSMNVGQQTVDKLKKNKQLGWKFVSAKKAADGLKSNEYYTVVTIPKDFSKNAATVLSSHPKKMQLTYKTNDSLNYLSQVISGIGVDTLDKEIRANVTNAYASALFEQVKVVGKGMKTAGKGATQINNGLVTLDDGINTYTVGVSTVHDGIQTMSLKVSPLSSGVQQLTTGANQLSSGVSTYVAGTNQVASGLGTLNGSVKTLRTGVTSYTGYVSDIADGLNSMQDETQELPDAAARMSKGSSALAAGLPAYVSQVNTIVDQVTGNLATLKKIEPLLANVNTQISEATAQMTAMQQQITAGRTAATSIAANYSSSASDLGTKIKDNPEALNDLNNMTASFKQMAGLTEQSANQTEKALNAMQAKISTLMQNKDIQDMTKQLPDLVTQLEDLNSKKATLTQYGSKFSSGATQLNDGLQALNKSVPTLIAGINKLSSGANTLNANSSTLNNGTAQLVSGVSQLNAGGQQLAANGSALTSGASQVAGGLTTMNSQLPALTSGVQQLLDGTTQLTDNNKELTGGASKLKGGSKTLAKSLVSGAKEVNGIKLTSATADMFAAPTKTKHTYYSKVTNYGHALAPYVLSLALYVGALVFNFAYPIRKVSRRDGTPTQWFFSKITIGAIVATGMAVVEATLIMVGGLHVEHVALFYFIAWLFAMTSMYLVMFLSMWLDNPGRFIAMVLLMLQLGGSGGTFPMEITNHFYNVIHPFLPMTHSILGFRQAITSGIASGTVGYGIFYMILVAVISLGLLWLVMHRLQKKGLMGISQLDDNQKLQAVEK
ncbi:MAG: YhgE/Pip domain-containing protein [Lactobacillaceae bacterium]|jgi:putative membrane protein|nr:YhgE/Pip domain-containing protein [Lactobacillaceae bacterium]